MSGAFATFVLAALIASTASGAGRHGSEDQGRVGPGVVRPVYPPSPDQTELEVDAFLLDRFPVTNAQLLSFVQKNPQWRRAVVKPLHADDGYLSHWATPTRLGPRAPANAPVTRVSWFAARAYCKARGARLPTEAEWELAASATETATDGSNDAAFKARILSWYSRPTPAVLPEVGRHRPNAWGVHDLHGLVWEWVDDFGNTLVTSDSRGGGEGDNRLAFCGTGVVGAGDKTDYAAFMRVAFRSSLKGRYTVANLGFRCARSLPEVK